MSTNGNGNGNGYKSVMPSGIATNANPYRSSGSPKEQGGEDAFDDEIVFDPIDADAPPTEPPDERRAKRRRKKIIAGMMIVVLVVGVALIAFTRLARKTRVDYRVQEQQRREAGMSPAGASSNADNTTRQAVADAQNSIMNTPLGAAEVNPVDGTTSVVPGASPAAQAPASPLILPDVAGTVTTTNGASGRTEEATVARSATGGEADTATTARTTRGTQARTAQTRAGGGTPSRRNAERSIFMTEADAPPAAFMRASFPAPQREIERGARSALEEQPTAIKPPFGSMLPVRTLGAIYTLRSGTLARMELTRDVAGNGWNLRRGTILVGTLRGSEYDRAYLTLVGFIDPATSRLVKVGGDVLGSDGGAGLKGKRRRIDSRWTRVLGQAATSAIGVTQSLLAGRNGGTTIIMPTAQSAFGPELYGLTRNGNRREFVEVEAGANGYVMVTDLPREIRGVDVLAEMSGHELAQTIDGTPAGISEAELADLLSTNSPEQIRAALPRMTPEMRRIAQAVLNDGAR